MCTSVAESILRMRLSTEPPCRSSKPNTVSSYRCPVAALPGAISTMATRSNTPDESFSLGVVIGRSIPPKEANPSGVKTRCTVIGRSRIRLSRPAGLVLWYVSHVNGRRSVAYQLSDHRRSHREPDAPICVKRRAAAARTLGPWGMTICTARSSYCSGRSARMARPTSRFRCPVDEPVMVVSVFGHTDGPEGQHVVIEYGPDNRPPEVWANDVRAQQRREREIRESERRSISRLFTDEARRVIVVAQEEARRLGHNEIGDGAEARRGRAVPRGGRGPSRGSRRVRRCRERSHHAASGPSAGKDPRLDARPRRRRIAAHGRRPRVFTHPRSLISRWCPA